MIRNKKRSGLLRRGLPFLMLLFLLSAGLPAHAAPGVENLKVAPHPGNDRYLCLTFDFESAGKPYTVFLTGLRTGADPALWAEKLALQVADRFSQGKPLRVAEKSTGKPGEYAEPALGLMDAEKQDLFPPPDWNAGDIPTVLTDTELCWAASASNALELSGWGRAAAAANPGKVSFENEDDLFEYFAANFMDCGNLAIEGERWFLNGLHHEVATDWATGEPQFGRFSWEGAQLWEKGSGGLMKNVCAASVTSRDYDFVCTGARDHASALGLRQGADDLARGYGVSLGIEFVGRLGGHDLCLTGTVRDRTPEGPGEVRAVFLADSDNDAATYDYNDAAAAAQARPRSGRVNSFEMYPVAVKTIADEETVIIDGFWMHPENPAMISDIMSIRPYSSAAPKETEGSREVYAAPDLVPTEIVAGSDCFRCVTVPAGEPVELRANIANQSYVPVTSESSATVTLRYRILKDGREVDSVTRTVLLEGRRLFPLSGSREGSEILYTFREPGVYDIAVSVLHAEDARGGIREAYTGNNTLKYARVTVKSFAPPPPPTGDRAPLLLWIFLAAVSGAVLLLRARREHR